MKRLAWLALPLFAFLPLRGDEEIHNGDFSEGTAHWISDGKVPTADNGDADPFAKPTTPPPAGMSMDLRSSRWSKMSQEFTAHSPDVTLTIVYTLSDDTVFSERAEDYVNVAEQIGCTGLMSFNTPPSNLVAIVNDPAKGRFNYYMIKPILSNGGTQTFSGKLGGLVAGEDKLFILAFPPGQGTVTIKSVSISD
jgi:hypothetical protein